MRKIGRTMLRGLMAVLPAVLTLYILYWLLWSAETVLGTLIKVILPDGWYMPGMGLLAGLVMVYLLGLTMNAFLVRRVFDLSETLMNRIPLVKTLYGSVKDFIGFFAHKRERDFNQVVTVELLMGGVPMRFLGFVTRTDWHDLPEGIGGEGDVAVYLPLSYQIGGYTIIVPRSAVRQVDLSMHKAMGFAVTGGMFTEKGNARKGDRASEP